MFYHSYRWCMNVGLHYYDDNPIQTSKFKAFGKNAALIFPGGYCCSSALCTPSRKRCSYWISPIDTSGSYEKSRFSEKKCAPMRLPLLDYFRINGLFRTMGAGQGFHFILNAQRVVILRVKNSFEGISREGNVANKDPRKRNYNGYTENEAPLNITHFDLGEHKSKDDRYKICRICWESNGITWEGNLMFLAAVFLLHIYPILGAPLKNI